MYICAIRAARAGSTANFAQSVWQERGRWRKRPTFQALPTQLRMKQDFEFAREMVETLVAFGQLAEALMVIKSLVRLFKWEFHQMRSLYEAAIRYGNVHVAAAVSDIANQHRPDAARFRRFLDLR